MTGAAATPPLSRRLSIAHMALIAPWVALVIGSFGSISDNSFLWHVRAGTLQIDVGSVLTSDPFSFTATGQPWRTQSWLTELLYGWLEGRTGLGFVPYMILAVATLTFIGIGLVAYQKARSVPATAFVMVLSVLALISFLVPRPVLFSYLLMVLVIAAWERPKARWMLPFLFWMWAAVHGSFVIGLGYIGLSLLMNRDWRELPKAMASGLATLATAHGIGVLTFLAQFAQNREALQYITEWRRPELLDIVFLPFAGGVLFIVIGALRGRIFPRHLWLIVPFLVLGMGSVRGIPPAWLALAPLVGLSLSGLQIGSRAGLRARLAAVFAVFVLGLPFLLIRPSVLAEDKFPVMALAHLDDSPTFHDDRVGGYLIWAEGPERKVYIDDRAELYGDRMAEFVSVRSGEAEWEPVFERDGVSQALLAVGEPLIESLGEAGWNVAYEDEDFVVMRP